MKFEIYTNNTEIDGLTGLLECQCAIYSTCYTIHITVSVYNMLSSMYIQHIIGYFELHMYVIHA